MIIKNREGYPVHITTTPPPIALLPLGTEVTSRMEGRENGIIIGYNDNRNAFYERGDYPYVILWEDSYFEVYGISSFEVKAS